MNNSRRSRHHHDGNNLVKDDGGNEVEEIQRQGYGTQGACHVQGKDAWPYVEECRGNTCEEGRSSVLMEGGLRDAPMEITQRVVRFAKLATTTMRPMAPSVATLP